MSTYRTPRRRPPTALEYHNGVLLQTNLTPAVVDGIAKKRAGKRLGSSSRRARAIQARIALAGQSSDPNAVVADDSLFSGDSMMFDDFDSDVIDNLSSGVAITDDAPAEVFQRRRDREYDTISGNRSTEAHQHWLPQMEALTDALLRFRHHPPEVAADADTFDLNTVCASGSCRKTFKMNGTTVAESLVHAGYLPVSPIEFSTAVSVFALEILRHCKRRHASFSVQAMARVLADLNGFAYADHFRTQVADVFDVYLDLLRRIRSRVMTVLGRDGPHWRMLNACACCQYKLAGEPTLKYDLCVSMDANDSQKRFSRSGVTDSRSFPTDYFLSRDDVNRFQHEVHRRPAANPPARVEGEAMDGCAQKWKAQVSQEKEQGTHTWSIFDECGIYTCVCRHGFVLVAADLVKSGELAKYPLAVLDKLMKVYDTSMVVGSDIACTQSVTVSNSSLGDRFKALAARLSLNGFHGWAHNRGCQLNWHPRWQEGLGLNELEGCERLFSSVNGVAKSTRYASPYRRHQSLEIAFEAWDEEKYCNLSTFLYAHIKRALGIIRDDSPAIATVKAHHGIQDSDFPKFVEAEREYLAGLKTERPEASAQVMYVQYLDKLAAAYKQWEELDDAVRADAAAHTSLQPVPGSSRSGRILTLSVRLTQLDERLPAVRERAFELRAAFERLQTIQQTVATCEITLEIAERWTPESDDYRSMKTYIENRQYYLCLDKVHLLVVKRLFEMEKLGLAGTGYKQRVHIARALQSRSAAIRTALDHLNEAGQKLTPSRAPLDWSSIVEKSYLSEFDLLRESSVDIRNALWAQPDVRRATEKSLHVARAEEELIRCEVEVRRLLTSMRDEEAAMRNVSAQLLSTEPAIAHEIQETLRRRCAVNEAHRKRFSRLFKWHSYTGPRLPGVRIGSGPTVVDGEAGVAVEAGLDGEWEDYSDDGDEGEGQEERDYNMSSFIETLS